MRRNNKDWLVAPILFLAMLSAVVPLTSQAAGADPGTGGQIFEGKVISGDQYISRIFTFGNGADAQTVGQYRRHVLHAVHGQIHPSVQKGFFNFFDKKPLAAQSGQGHMVPSP